MKNDNDKLAKPKDDDAIISECVDRLKIAIAAESENRTLAMDDLAFLKGDQWDERVKAQRAMDGRPCLTINKLPVSLHQVTNSQRQNVPSIKVHPVSEGTDQKLAEVVQGAIRHIEYKSKADVAYDTAVNSAAAIGIGYFRLITKYVSPDSFDQEIAFQRIRNAFTVYMDPNTIEVDGSDMQWCILSEKMPRSEFRLKYPDADACSADVVRGMGDRFIEWASDTEVRVSEYYRIHNTKATLVLLSNGESGWKEDLLELPEGVDIVKERSSLRPKVEWFKLSACDVLERADIPCDWIPVFPVFGDEIDLDGKVYRSGMIRNAKDPARMYNFWMTSATEEVALRPKTPYIGAEGQFEGHESDWAQANTRSFPFLQYKPRTLGGSLAPPPQRQPMADLPTGVLQMAMHANDDVKATTGIFDASLGARSNETSGKAINARDRQGEVSNYHYTDNLNISLRHAGRCILNMWPKIYDGTRTLEIMGHDGKVSSTEVNKPIPPEEQKPNPFTGAVDQVMNDMTVGEFSVTISVGPSYDTLRQEAVEGMVAVAQSWPKLMDIAGDKVVRSMDWPMSDDIADRIEKSIDPALLKEENEDASMVETPRGPIPVDQVGAMLAQMDQQIQEMGAALKDAESGIETARISAESNLQKAQLDAESRERVAQINATAKNDVAELTGLIQILIQKMQPPPELAAKAMTTGDNASSETPSTGE